jgi:RNA polymerase sigma-70 factor (ECF subfamily)
MDQLEVKSHPAGSGRMFHTTHWSVVLAAGTANGEQTSAALEELCRAYWYPVYAYARRCGYNTHDAEDLTQEFFYRLLDRRYLAQADPRKGRFRSFLLVAFKHFLVNEWDRAKAVKRGGKASFISIDHETAEAANWEPRTSESADQAFARTWALVFLERVVGRLRSSLARSEQHVQFDALKQFLIGGDSTESYAQLAVRLGTSEDAIKMAVQRLRRRFAQTLREEIAHTVVRPDEIEDEIRCLFAAVCA